ncbi:MAG: hypothetical protein LPK02_07120 [Rhodobacterales bacterium]|nr:hypothetical protein [Rhodobacterales bacterium]
MAKLGAIVFALNDVAHELRDERLRRVEKPSHPQTPTKKRAKVKAARKQRRQK